MARVLYFDCFSGISGDMLLGALLDAGLPLDELRGALGSLAVSGYEIGTERVLRAGVTATRFLVHELGTAATATPDRHEHSAPAPTRDHVVMAAAHAHGESGSGLTHTHEHDHQASGPQHTHAGSETAHGHPQDSVTGAAHTRDHEHPLQRSGHDHHDAHRHEHRSLLEIFGLIDRSALPQEGRDRAKALFRRLAEAEAAIHQMPVEQVHLHEVGALDSIIDIVGAVFGLAWFAADAIVCSPLNLGGGMVESAHGLFPVPAPATVALLGDAPIYGGPIQHELVTPTGALIVSAYANAFGPIPPMAIERVGYGAGSRDFSTTPNVLRVLVGRAAERAVTDRVVVVECEIDDMNPQLFGVAMDRLYAAGALEVFYVPVQMKKNRPGTLLTVIAPPSLRTAVTDIVFAETTTIGLRYVEMDRECLPREIVTVETRLGAIRFKLARRGGAVINAAPEFEDCVRLAAAHDLPVKSVQALAIDAYGAGRTARAGGPAERAS